MECMAGHTTRARRFTKKMMPTSRAVHCLLLAITAAIAVYEGLYAASDPETDLERKAGDRVQSLRDLRFRGMVEQSTVSSCGAASVAILASLCLDVRVAEEEALGVVEASVRARVGESARTEAITALDLRVAARSLGLDLRGFRVTIAALRDYFLHGGLPVIAHGTCPHPHFLVVVGIIDGEVMVADPSWGRELFPLNVFAEDKGFTGVILVPALMEEQMDAAREGQKNLLVEAGERQRTLRELRASFP